MSPIAIPVSSPDDEPGSALVSEEDHVLVSKYKWHARYGRNTMYVQGNVDGKIIRLHRFLMGTKSNFVIDHLDRDGLNNTRENLRFVTLGQNSQNSQNRAGTSEFRGVSWSTQVKKWHVKCGGDHIAYFRDEDEAARSYDEAVLRKYGRNAVTNFFIKDEDIEIIINQERSVKDSKILPRGVTKKAEERTYKASLTWDGVSYKLGRFETPEKAHEAYLEKHTQLSQTALQRHYQIQIAREEESGIAKIDIYDQAKVLTAIALVSDEDWHRLSLVKWSESDGYALGSFDGVQTSMHKVVVSAAVAPGLVIDHINRNRLDNRRENLRVVTPSDNSQNRDVSKNNTTGYVGVERKKNNSRWSARISKEYIEYQLGSYDHPILAAVAYNIQALKLYDRPFMNSIYGEIVTDMQHAQDIVFKGKPTYDMRKVTESIDGMTLSEGSTSKKRDGTASKYKGVTKSCGKNRWNAEIAKDGQRHKLGVFSSEESAALAYNSKAIELFTNPRLNVVTEADVPEMPERTTSKYRGVSWSKKYEKWVAQLRHDKKNHFVGNFSDETEAAKAVNRKCRELIGPDVAYNDVSDDDELQAVDLLGSVTDGRGQKKRSGSSQFKGVSKTPFGTFTVEFNWKGKRYRGGTHRNEVEAGKRYNELALEVTANEEEKPRLNIIPDD